MRQALTPFITLSQPNKTSSLLIIIIIIPPTLHAFSQNRQSDIWWWMAILFHIHSSKKTVNCLTLFCQLLLHLRSGERLKTSSLFKAIDLWTAQHNLFHSPNVSFFLSFFWKGLSGGDVHVWSGVRHRKKPALINQKHKTLLWTLWSWTVSIYWNVWQFLYHVRLWLVMESQR